jgi:hypothetical protein
MMGYYEIHLSLHLRSSILTPTSLVVHRNVMAFRLIPCDESLTKDFFNDMCTALYTPQWTRLHLQPCHDLLSKSIKE